MIVCKALVICDGCGRGHEQLTAQVDAIGMKTDHLREIPVGWATKFELNGGQTHWCPLCMTTKGQVQ